MKAIFLYHFFFLSMISGLMAQYQNILISEQNLPNEPAIMFNPLNPSEMVIGANIANLCRSTDGGMTWTAGIITSSYGIWGDPCIVADRNGIFYYFHINNNQTGTISDQIICHRSFDGGLTWDNGFPFGKNGEKFQEKIWAVSDPETHYLYAAWTQDDVFGSATPGDSSNIMFSRSTDQGQTWSIPVRINRVAGHCILDGYGVNGSMPFIGPDGRLMVIWSGPEGIMFTKSEDKGISWPAENIKVADLPAGWGCLIPGIYRAPGFAVASSEKSIGPYRGNIYLCWCDQRNGPDDADIWFCRSSDGGSTWSAPLRVNDDSPGRQQFFSWLTVDQVTGYIYIVFYDRRNYSDLNTDVFLAFSKDGGQTFRNVKISESPFIPDAAIFFGDYSNIMAHNNIVRPVWTRMDGGKLSLWTAKVDSIDLAIPPQDSLLAPFALRQNYPNPSDDYTNFAYSVRHTSDITLKIFDYTGREIAVVFENKLHQPGQYIERFPIDTRILPPGFYYYSLKMKHYSVIKKMIID